MQMRDFGDVLGCMHQLERNPFAMSARRKPPPFDNSDLVWRIGVNGIMRNTVHARSRDDLAGLNSSAIWLLLFVAYMRNTPFMAVFRNPFAGIPTAIQFSVSEGSTFDVAADATLKTRKVEPFPLVPSHREPPPRTSRRFSFCQPRFRVAQSAVRRATSHFRLRFIFAQPW
jgi:hypothetical protein